MPKPRRRLSPRRISAAAAIATTAALFLPLTSASLPYSATRIFLPSNYNNQVVYVLQPPSSAAPSGQLLALPLASSVLGTNLPYTTLSPALPFLTSSSSSAASTTAYTAAIAANGVLLVYAGACAANATAAALWTFQPDVAAGDYSGSWVREALSDAGLAPGLGLTGANFLAAGAAFQSTTEADALASLYVFGGMCPTTAAGAAVGGAGTAWIQDAAYSSQMLRLRPVESTESTSSSSLSAGPTTYEVSTAWSPAALIQEAGCSMTALQPTYSNSSNSSGGGSQFQQQDFVVLGGHTQDAFISTGKVALFSLPQSNWTFLDVEPPTAAKTDLVRSTAALQFTPRSGHSAVLSEDGTQIVIFGGWVGDTSQAAEPQIAILNVGQGYGGAGAWSWIAPNQTGLPFASGQGLYGHGAVVLPGNVMMVVGGFGIAPAGSAKAKRSVQAESKAWYFYNITSNSWISSYTLPVDKASTGGSGAPKTVAVGVGIGVGLGALAIFIAVLCGCVYYRRLKSKRELREKELNDLANAHRLHYGNLSGGIDGRGGDLAAGGVWDNRDNGSYDSYSWAPVIGTSALRGTRDAERTGIYLDNPSPTRGLRRNPSQRGGAYYSGPIRRNSLIHPIEERDEDETSNSESKQAEMTQIGHGADLDPFRDPDPLGSHPVNGMSRRNSALEPLKNGGPSVAEMRRASMQPSAEQEHMDYSKHANGRISPDKSERTSSTLSEQSTRSMISTISAISSRSARSLTAYRAGDPPQSRNPFNTPEIFAIRDQGASSNHYRSDTLTSWKSDTAYGTAMPSSYYPKLQTEGGPLLSNEDGEPSFARRNGKSVSPTRVRSYKMALVGGLVGSVRRALPSALRSASMTSAIVPPRSQLLAGTDSSSGNSSPARSRTDVANRELPPVPRRSASDSGAFWDRKRGARDWATDDLLTGDERDRRLADDWNAPPAAGTAYGAYVKPAAAARADADADDNEDWDVETAVQSRNVQIMFSVPREKLRVVNAEVASLASEGDAVEVAEPAAVVQDAGPAVTQEAGIVDESSLIQEAGVMERVAELEEMIELKKKED